MPHEHSRIEQVYYFNELSDRSKEKARSWYRDTDYPDYGWWDCLFDEFKELFGVLGYNIDQIYFSGFSSQGDGACFTGTWYSSSIDVAKAKSIISDWSTNTELHSIVNSMLDIISKHPTGLSASIKHRGYYYHENCVHIDVEIDNEDESSQEEFSHLEDAIIEVARDAMRWIYRMLEKEYDYLMSDECIDENIIANEYIFTDGGQRVNW